MDAANAATVRLQEAQAANAAILKQTQDERAASDAALAKVEARSAQLDQREKTLDDVNRTITEDKYAWEVVRQSVEAQNNQKSQELAALESALNNREAVVSQREHDVEALAVVANALKAKSESMIARVQALASDTAPPPGQHE